MILVLLFGGLALVLLFAGWRWAVIAAGATIVILMVNLPIMSRDSRRAGYRAAMRSDLLKIVAIAEQERRSGTAVFALPDSGRYRHALGVRLVRSTPTTEGFIAIVEHVKLKGEECQVRHVWGTEAVPLCYTKAAGT